ncbi:MAG: hypothetical protein U0264_00820 [Candidatus Kapaibacterium sp.]
MNTILTKSELESLLPDYAFGKASDEEIRLIERSLPYYPEIEQEFAEIKNVFGTIDSSFLESEIDHRTRNLSMKVNDRLRTTRSTALLSTAFWARFALPSVAVVILAVLGVRLLQPGLFTPHTAQVMTDSHIQLLHPDDTRLLINEDVSLAAALEEASNLVVFPESIPQASGAVEDLLAASVQEWNDDASVSYTHSDDLWLNLTETELQELLKDLRYENPSIL